MDVSANAINALLITRSHQIIEDYEKQLQHLKKEVELVKKDFDEWEKEHNIQSAR